MIGPDFLRVVKIFGLLGMIGPDFLRVVKIFLLLGMIGPDFLLVFQLGPENIVVLLKILLR